MEKGYAEKKQYLYLWRLPLIWALCSLITYYFYSGSEHVLYALSSLAGVWIAFIVEMPIVYQSQDISLYCVVLAGAVTVALCGWLMDRLRVPGKTGYYLWLLAFLCFFLHGVLIIGPSWCAFESNSESTPIYQLAPPYLFYSINMGIHALIAITIPIALLHKIIQRLRGKNQ